MNKLCSQRINIKGETKTYNIIDNGFTGNYDDLIDKITNDYSNNSDQMIEHIDGLKNKLLELESNDNKTPRDMYNNLDDYCDIYCNLLNIT